MAADSRSESSSSWNLLLMRAAEQSPAVHQGDELYHHISAPRLHGDVSPPPPAECFAGAAVRFNYMCSNYDRF